MTIKYFLLNLCINLVIFGIQNNDIILNKDKFYNHIIMEVRKIDIDGIGERRRIYFYDNGEIEDINFGDNGDISIESIKLKNKSDINFLNNISLEAINSVGNDEIQYIQKYKNKNLRLENKTNFEFLYIENSEKLGNTKQEAIINNRKKQINYIQQLGKENALDKNINLIFREGSIYFYEVKYKGKVFKLSNLEYEYENREIKNLIRIISTPFFILNTEKISDRAKIEPNIQIEKIEFLDDSHYNYSKYTLFDNKEILKTFYEKTNMINQLNIETKKYKLSKNLFVYFKNELPNILLKSSNNILEYSYSVNSLDEISNSPQNNSKMIVTYNNTKFENPTIYKIYFDSLNPYVIVDNGSKENQNHDIIEKIKDIEKNEFIKKIEMKKIQTKLNVYNNYKEREIVVFPEWLGTDSSIYEKMQDMEDFEFDLNFNKKREKINCNNVRFNYSKIGALKNRDFSLTQNIKFLNLISKKLKYLWKYKGITIEEEVKNWYKKYNEVCNYEKLIEKDEIFQNLK